MARLGKYMVFNPLHGKPVKFYADESRAIKIAEKMRNELGEDFLVIQVISIARKEGNTKRLSKMKEATFSRLMKCVWDASLNKINSL